MGLSVLDLSWSFLWLFFRKDLDVTYMKLVTSYASLFDLVGYIS